MKNIEVLIPFKASLDDGLTNTSFTGGVVEVPIWLAKLAVKEKWAKYPKATQIKKGK